MQNSNEAPIRIESLSYSVDGATVLDAIDLTVQAREIVGVMGRSGIGKTTLLRLVMGLIRPDAGRIIIGGADITIMDEMALDHLRLTMGMVFQGAALFDSMTVGENVGFALVEHRGLASSELAHRVGDLSFQMSA